MTKISDHMCPNCDTTLGSLRNIDSDTGEITEGDKEDVTSICLVCGAFLKILSFTAGRAQVRAMEAEEIMALPDEERITLQRVVRTMKKYPTALIKESLEAHMAFRAKFDQCKIELTRRMDEMITEYFGPEIGCMLILKHLKPMGFYGMVCNFDEGLQRDVLRRALVDVDGSAGKIIREVLRGDRT